MKNPWKNYHPNLAVNESLPLYKTLYRSKIYSQNCETTPPPQKKNIVNIFSYDTLFYTQLETRKP